MLLCKCESATITGMKSFASQIYAAVGAHQLQEPFNAAAVKSAVPGWADRTYYTFLSKHAVGNGNNSELFERVGRGEYRLRRP
jgi:hypothetical protein